MKKYGLPFEPPFTPNSKEIGDLWRIQELLEFQKINPAFHTLNEMDRNCVKIIHKFELDPKEFKYADKPGYDFSKLMQAVGVKLRTKKGISQILGDRPELYQIR